MLLSRSPLASLRRGVPFDLHVLGAPPAFILSQDRTLRPKYSGLRARPVLTTVTLIGSVRFIWFCIGKEFLGAASRRPCEKQIQVRPFQMVRCLPGCDTECVHPRSIRFSRCTPGGWSGPTGPRGKEIYCQTGGPPGAGIAHSIFCSQMNRSLSRITEVKTEALASDIGDHLYRFVHYLCDIEPHTNLEKIYCVRKRCLEGGKSKWPER